MHEPLGQLIKGGNYCVLLLKIIVFRDIAQIMHSHKS